MTDKYESKARELLLDDCFIDVQESFTDEETAVALITAALRSARAEAFEEAAAMVERLVVPFPSRELDSIARRIRSLGLDKETR